MNEPERSISEETVSDADRATQIFVGHRELLFSVVYNMLGSVADTEDVLQDVWLSWAARSAADVAPGSAAKDTPQHAANYAAQVENPRAYLVRMAVNQALARRATVTRRRETYVGPWLPEPLVVTESNAEAEVLRAESLSTAVLVVLESLAPVERAVFVLTEVFGYSHGEIGAMLDRSPAAVRQLAYRARQHVAARRPRTQADPQLRREVTERFIAATMNGDIEGLLAVLAPDVTLWTDGGAKGPAHSLQPVHGWERVAKLFLELARGGALRAYEVRWRTVSGDPCAVVFEDGAPLAVLVLDVTPDNTVRGIYSVTNPDKLTGVR